MEYIYKVFRKKFRSATPNLDMLSRRFNQLAYWAPTEICTCINVHKRALMLRKFIKLAQQYVFYFYPFFKEILNLFAYYVVLFNFVAPEIFSRSLFMI